METVKISRDSWHYKLNRKLGNSNYDLEFLDICGYRSKTIISLILVLLISLFFGGILFISGTMLGILAGFFATLYVEVSLVIPGIFIFFGLFFWYKHYLSGREYVPEKPGPVKEMYLSFKEKYCKRIEIV